jgi:hypothetical protein
MAKEKDMGLFSFGPTKESRTQLLFRDEGSFEFRRLEIEDTFLVEKKDGKKDSDIVRGWKHFYENQFPFPGYGRIPADMVTLGFNRDIILDPYGIVKREELPPEEKQTGEGDALVLAWPQGNGHKGRLFNKGQPWLVEVGHARRLKILAKRGRASIYDKIVYFIGATLLLEIVIILIKVGQAHGGG